jgi:hypothetical protein
MNYYIVSEKELELLKFMFWELGNSNREVVDLLDPTAYNTIGKERPVPEWATHLAGGEIDEAYLPMSGKTEYSCSKIEEIKK